MGEGEKDQQETKEQKQKPKKWKRNNGTQAAKEPGARREQESGRERDLGKRAQSGRGPAHALWRTMDRARRRQGPHPSRGRWEKALRDRGRRPCPAPGVGNPLPSSRRAPGPDR